VQLWTVGNYHWYLKQEFRFDQTPERDNRASSVLWDDEDPFTLFIATRAGNVTRIQVTRDIHELRSETSSNQSMVAVTDAGNVLVTPFRRMVVPQPMSDSQVPVGSCARSLSFGPPSPECQDQLAVLDTGGTISFFRQPKNEEKWTRAGSIDICAALARSGMRSLGLPRHLCWLSPHSSSWWRLTLPSALTSSSSCRSCRRSTATSR
jgi:hypothetical protein